MQLVKFISLCFIIFLASCASTYVPPSDTQPSAYLSGYSDAHMETIVYNEKNCYTGQVTLPLATEGKQNAATSLKIHAEKQVAVVYENNKFNGRICRVIGGFTPVKDHYYVAVGGTIPQQSTSSWLAKLFVPSIDACMISVHEVEADGNVKPVEVETLRIKQKGFACIRFEK